jgi:hypothetical protein
VVLVAPYPMADSGPTMIGCPACAGVLRAEVGQHGNIVLICSVGHAFSLADLYQAKEEQLEACEWSMMALLKHIQMILGMLLESGLSSEPFNKHTIQQRLAQARDHVTMVEEAIQRTQWAVREVPVPASDVPGDGP